jgi:hypothetical protein
LLKEKSIVKLLGQTATPEEAGGGQIDRPPRGSRGRGRAT